MRKPDGIHDRDREWQALERIWNQAGPDLVFALGRRRAGKSFLLTQFAQAAGGLYYQATKRTESEQLQRLSAVLGLHFGDVALLQGVALPDWEALFGYLFRHARREPLVLVLDEFTLLSEAAPALPSILQALWDHEWRSTRLKVILSGSHISAMRQLERGDQPLFGRRTARIDVKPFLFRDAAEFFPLYDVRDRLLAYGMFGGLPGHLALLDPAALLEENVARHVLSTNGRLHDEAQHMLDAFVADAQVYYSVLAAIAGGEHTWSGITSRVGRAGGSLSRSVHWLMEMGLIERMVPITESNAHKSKRAQYRIADPYVEFWHRLVLPLLSAGMIGLRPPEQLWAEHIAPRLDNYMGGVFESVCRSFVWHTNRLPFQPLRVGAWWDGNAQNEIDVVALGARGEVLVGECKWGTATLDDAARLRARSSRMLNDVDEVSDVWIALFATSASADVQREADRGRLLLFTAESLYEPEPWDDQVPDEDEGDSDGAVVLP